MVGGAQTLIKSGLTSEPEPDYGEIDSYMFVNTNRQFFRKPRASQPNIIKREIACLNYTDTVYSNQVRPKSGAEARLELNSGPENAGTLYGQETIITPAHHNQTPTPDMSMKTKSPKLVLTSEFN